MNKKAFVLLALMIGSILSLTLVTVDAKAALNQYTFTYKNQYGTYTATVYYTSTAKNAPVVLFLHGYASLATWYTWLQQPVTSAGYVLVMLEVPNALWGDLSSSIQNIQARTPVYASAFSSCIDSMLTQSKLNGIINPAEIFASGHSLGGLGAMIAASQDSRIKAVSAWSPPIDLSGLSLPTPTKFTCPVQLIVGSQENAMYTSIVNYYNNELVAPQKDLFVVQGGTHLQYLDSNMVSIANYFVNLYSLPYVSGETATISVAQQHQEVMNAFLSFL